jgi:hypothetical protein
MSGRDKFARTKLPPVVPADVSSALYALGIDHVIRDDEALALCPNPDHSDRKPSWSCNLETGLHNCFSCGFSGSFVRLVALVRGVRPAEATGWIQTRKVRSGPSQEEVERAVEQKPAVSEADLWEVTDPPEWALAERHISLLAAQTLEIRWHPRKERWVFPIRDPKTDRLLGWQEKAKGIFLNRPKDVQKASTLFGFKQLKATGNDGPVVIVESPLDTARFWTAGHHRVVSTFGIEFSDYQISLLWPYADELIFAPDNDLAGQRKLARWLTEFAFERNRIKVFDYGGAFDARDAIVHPEGDGRDPGNLSNRELRRGIEYATPAWRTYFEGINWWG